MGEKKRELDFLRREKKPEHKQRMASGSKDLHIGETPVKFRPLKSKRFVCSKCLDFVIEWTPVINKEMLGSYVLSNGIPQVKMVCGRDCHKSPWWSFYDINDPRTRARY